MVILARSPDPPDPTPALVAALARFTATKGCPDYLKDAAAQWLAAHNLTTEQ